MLSLRGRWFLSGWKIRTEACVAYPNLFIDNNLNVIVDGWLHTTASLHNFIWFSVKQVIFSLRYHFKLISRVKVEVARFKQLVYHLTHFGLYLLNSGLSEPESQIFIHLAHEATLALGCFTS